MEQTSFGPKQSAWEHVEVYEYLPGLDVHEALDWDVPGEGPAILRAGKPTHEHGSKAGPENSNLAERESFEKKLAEEKHRTFEEGRQRGVLEGRQAEREAQAATLAGAERNRVLQSQQLIESFAIERDRFLHTVEKEVVRLALAVAARILRREAQMDPLLLTGAVRVALGQLAGSTEVRLKVPAGELDLWNDAVAHLPNLALKPTLVAGDGMRLGECFIESRMGTVDLGIRAQLAEIERGFFDRVGGEITGRREGQPEDSSAGLETTAVNGGERNG